MSQKLFISRTGLETYDACARKYFWNNLVEGTGIVPSLKSLALETGTATHKGMEHLLNAHKFTAVLADDIEDIVDKAVEIALEYWNEVKNQIAYKGGDNNAEFGAEETGALIEIFIRGFACNNLQEFLNRYEIFEIEYEEVLEIPPEYYDAPNPFSEPTKDIVKFLGKADGVLWDRQRQLLVILSLKTTSGVISTTESQIRHDMQGMSECLLLNRRIGQYLHTVEHINTLMKDTNKTNEVLSLFDLPDWFIKLYKQDYFNGVIKVETVQYIHFTKGQIRETAKNSGVYRLDNSILHPYKNEDASATDFANRVAGDSVARVIDTTSTSIWKWKVNQGRQPNGWNKVNIWEHMNLKDWIYMLQKGLIQPEEGRALARLTNISDQIPRNYNSQLEWAASMIDIATTIYRRNNIFKSTWETRLEDHSNFIVQFGKYFRRVSKSCHNYYGGDCPYILLCWGDGDFNRSVEEGFYVTRQPHHKEEADHFVELTFIKDVNSAMDSGEMDKAPEESKNPFGL